MTSTEAKNAGPDYMGFGASVSGALDVYVTSDDASPAQTISHLIDLAARYGITIGTPE